MNGNEPVIKEFRANNGQVGGRFEGVPLLLLTTRGRRTGKPHTTPAVYLRDGDRYLVFGSNGGDPEHPHWFRNLVAAPAVTLELGTAEGRVKPFAARAVVLEGEERDRHYERQCALDPAFREYRRRAAARVIPVVALQLLDLAADGERNVLIGRQLLIHHEELRAELAEVRAAVDEAAKGGGSVVRSAPPGLSRQLRRRCLDFCYGLQLHHTREDGVFTAFEARFPHLVPAVTRLREEHAVVERALARLADLLEMGPAADPGGPAALKAELDRVIDGLEEHFAYEEEHLLPALGLPRPA
ncbi:nitroreductase/quinone reductase family protein [Kitasatospora sp. NPDC093806]|uniref:nitroreductase/quinone reductase family protein n=1 Tax=Kitasatospora sp. NPDC093806 TaxID=3155075 RepID=UPI0034120F5F